ncbi:MAG: MBL fold metallo-hydrolase, partial [Oligoflexus sp.]|nr:MBL fold metallo-hydrolase [Pseudopedobacter sp.]
LLRGDSIVNIKGRELSVFATIKRTDLLSGHGDHQDLIDYVMAIPNSSLRSVFLVHGERENMNALKTSLKEQNISVAIPKKGMVFEL